MLLSEHQCFQLLDLLLLVQNGLERHGTDVSLLVACLFPDRCEELLEEYRRKEEHYNLDDHQVESSNLRDDIRDLHVVNIVHRVVPFEEDENALVGLLREGLVANLLVPDDLDALVVEVVLIEQQVPQVELPVQTNLHLQELALEVQRGKYLGLSAVEAHAPADVLGILQQLVTLSVFGAWVDHLDLVGHPEVVVYLLRLVSEGIRYIHAAIETNRFVNHVFRHDGLALVAESEDAVLRIGCAVERKLLGRVRQGLVELLGVLGRRHGDE